MKEQIKNIGIGASLNPGHENWNEFFSRLAHAENAAAIQCEAIADLFSKRGEMELADTYRRFSDEEAKHFRLVSKICKPLLEAPKCARRIYDGELMNATGKPLERMAIIHLVFEPSALAFLGFFHQHGNELIEDQTWSREIKNSFREILQDEVAHVYSGKNYIKALLKTSSAEEIAITKRAMKRHRTFIIAGIKEMFKTSPNSEIFLESMLSRFNWNYAKANEGVFV